MKTHICSNTTDKLGYILSLVNFKFHVCFCGILSTRSTRWRRKLHSEWATQACPTQTYNSTSLLCVLSHTHSHPVLQVSLRFRTTFLPSLHNNSCATDLLTPTSTSKVQVFSKVKCSIYTVVFMYLLTI